MTSIESMIGKISRNPYAQEPTLLVNDESSRTKMNPSNFCELSLPLVNIRHIKEWKPATTRLCRILKTPALIMSRRQRKNTTSDRPVFQSTSLSPDASSCNPERSRRRSAMIGRASRQTPSRVRFDCLFSEAFDQHGPSTIRRTHAAGKNHRTNPSMRPSSPCRH
jgi:hypothetical protein